MSPKKPPRRSALLREYVRDLGKPPVKRYVEVQRARGHLFAIGNIDVDIDQLVDRTFLCDRHRCIQWAPHDKLADAQPLIDHSCCSRYTVPVTLDDRGKLAEILPLVRKRLAKDHPLNEDDAAPPYELQPDYSLAMREQPGPPFDRGTLSSGTTCQFVLYEKGLTTCAIHKTCLEEGLSPWEYKPLGCSLWPLAILDYEDDDGKERLLLTVYARATSGLFDDEGDDDSNDETEFACLLDRSPDYAPLYRETEGILKQAFGAEFYKKLDSQARKYLSTHKE
jgi:hypothetical protein